MTVQLKRLDRQVMVITGASSGIGLTTARMAAQNGMRLVLAARSQEALRQLTSEITSKGGKAVFITADVSKQGDVQKIASKAQEMFGGFDTWVNNAGTSVYGELLDVPIEDMRQLFETNFWGVVYGSLVAAQHLKQHGGVLINLGSTLSDRAIPLQGMYCASKHAVKGFTDALRMELEMSNAPVSVTLIKPGAINTPFPHNAKNYLEVEPKLPTPLYAPETVAQAILHCATTPERDVFIGAGGKALSTLGYYTPLLTDYVMELTADSQQGRLLPSRPREQNTLYHPSERLKERGDHDGYVVQSSLYTEASLHPIRASVALIGVGLAIAALRTFLRRLEHSA